MPKTIETVSDSNVSVENDDAIQDSNESKQSYNNGTAISEPNCKPLHSSFFVGNENMGDRSKCIEIKCKTKRQHVTHEFRTTLLDSLGRFRVVIVLAVSRISMIYFINNMYCILWRYFLKRCKLASEITVMLQFIRKI